MSISVLDRKMLWGRSGMRCAICQVVLAPRDELGGSTIIGEEAHIVARSPAGPRGDSPLTAEQRDRYSNLILLCPTDHTKIDSEPHGASEYSSERLLEIKRRHEEAVLAGGQIDSNLQVAEEQWATLIDRLSEIIGWNNWMDDMSGLFDPNVYRIKFAVLDRISATCQWIIGRSWPTGHDRLRSAIETLPMVFYDFHRTFAVHSEPAHLPDYLTISKFFHLREWDPELWEKRHNEYEEHVELIEDLMLELTRYGNLIAKLVREEIDSFFRFEEGLLLVVVGPTEALEYVTFGPQFSDAELEGGEPYQNPDQFRKIRSTRTPHAKQWH